MEETIRNHIRKQIVKMMEQENPKFVPVPYHVQPILKTLGLFPFNRYVSEVKHANTVPASEEINLVNGSKFFIYFGENKEVEIGGEKFFLDDKRNHYLIRDKINDLLNQGQIKGGEEAPEEAPDKAPEETPEESPVSENNPAQTPSKPDTITVPGAPPREQPRRRITPRPDIVPIPAPKAEKDKINQIAQRFLKLKQ
jgi:hypothetical protein